MNEKENNKDKILREQLVASLDGGNAHVTFDDFVTDFPSEKCGEKISGLPYTAWQVLEHMRIAQWDILEFSRNANHVSPKWPEGYWPKQDEAGNADLWQRSVEGFRSDLAEVKRLVDDPATDLFAKIPHGNGQTVLREALLVADHNAYHLGQFVFLRKMLEAGESDDSA